MPIVGFSNVHVAKYSASAGTVSYADGMKLGKAVEVDIQVETSNENNFYADDAVSESDARFSNGTLNHTPDDLMPEETALILGITGKAVAENSEIEELSYDDDMEPPYLGWGGVIKKRKNGETKYRAVVLPKVKYNTPNDAATTEGQTINWQTPSLTATIFRDDSEKHVWKREATFDTLAEAVAYVKKCLNIVTTVGVK